MLRYPRMSAFAAGGLLCMLAAPALAQSAPAQAPPTGSGFWADYIAGNWSLTLGASGTVGPSYEGASNMALSAAPMVSLARSGAGPAFTSRNDNPGLSLYDVGTFRIGPVGKILFTRDSSASNDLRGLRAVPWGLEAGLFADYYPTDWLRLRAEVRQGFKSHHGVVGDLAADAFYDFLPDWRISGGPRMSVASSSYYRAYYGVTPAESALSGLDVYSPGGGIKSVGFGGALTWKTTDKITTSAFAEYNRLTGPAADSSLVRQRGSVNQLMFGLSATYRFDFTL
ncbi:MipA/OmpV family protein [Labrys monachus]|uniref:Outer membrane scaffolding protein for murein synthesis (MipA/OmpV family) n=1 Tax=Labrys monachus TaxID=217067 RepID=A0ABU0FI27_9HYPH|nr:MipA/OmpV family protein [Labrys monachus]MDQ0394264.1 outer membrane scaffolding protein for murein synthesis (MipA/OmpV family) [Labrys monachus]